ncbi:cell division protein FtsQ [Lachnoclostridium sp. An169]|uniref:cell division protein FtsQ/DivIB n=1 Tax=Lachnoclostridium sp. An169 TaxID=1965569 RepID=UPI000B377C15|nr:cell division protein FtsQ [Lachnoclostridium sp. An169]OUP86560.1 cell division protein FtsQ [Lachnoclostridium sp. An169]
MKKAKHRRKRIWPAVLTVLGAIVLAGLIVVFGFRTRDFEVEGNSYYGETSITTWLQKDELSVNTLYILLKYNFTKPELPAAVESMDVSLKNPWTIHVKVKEKEMAGYVDYDGAYLYFDGEGTATVRTSQVIEGAPYIEGLEFDASKVVIGERLPVEDDSIFGKIVEVSRYLKKYSLAPDRMSCAGGDVQVYFGNVEVLLGSGNYDDRLAQVEPILEKLAERYPDTPGTLHLENYDSASTSIRFVPSA